MANAIYGTYAHRVRVIADHHGGHATLWLGPAAPVDHDRGSISIVNISAQSDRSGPIEVSFESWDCGACDWCFDSCPTFPDSRGIVD